MDRLRREMNRLYTDWSAEAGQTVAPGYPAMNIWTDDNNAVVTAELPGVSLESIEISVEDDTLTLRGDRQREEPEQGATYHRRERRFGSFVRSFRLPFRVDAEKVDATLRNGVLCVSLPRAEEDRPRRITIKAG
jgi:HSP20 family protein